MAAAPDRRAHLIDRLAVWPTAAWLHGFDGRVGLYLVSLAALFGLKWRNGYDLNAFMVAARDVAHGSGAYATTLATGVHQWGIDQVYVSPPFLAHVLAPLTTVPGEALFALWSLTGLLVLGASIRALRPDALASRAPRLVFGLGYIWATVFLGQVNLFVLAGLLLALGSRNDRLSGLGFAAAILLRGTPAIFGLALLFERRWRAIAWSAAFFIVGVLLTDPGDWLTYIDVTRKIASVPTLDVPVQMSLLYYGWPLTALAGAAMATVLILARRIPDEAALLRGTTIGLALVLLPGNSWVHWLSFALAPLLLDGDRALWSRRALIAFLFVGLNVFGWPSVLVCAAMVVAMTRRVLLAQKPGQAASDSPPDRSAVLPRVSDAIR